MEITSDLVVLIIYIIINIITFIMMGYDKLMAKRESWRISEKALIISAFAMGALGSFIGSYVFHHKTQKTKFNILLPVALIFNVVIIILAVKAGIWYLPF
ncbi:MAG: DUF1294 domain-containing protein [Clostridia bacterium]|nr:DUF1294 domain-containing protein [Clostridia bacterium]